MIKKKISIVLFLALHLAVLALIFSLSYFGISIQALLIISAAAFSLELVGLVFFSRVKISKIAYKLSEVEKEVVRFREESIDSEKIHRELLYIGHQLKSIQGEMDFLKRSTMFKTSGNGHHKGVHL